MGLYVLCAVLGLAFATWAMKRQGRASGQPTAARTPALVILGAAVGFALGAKLGYLLAEAPLLLSLPHGEALRLALAGKTVTGALLGGYAGVEWTKSKIGHWAPTGDSFALVVPFSLMLGRVGCLAAGCCPGVPWADHTAWTLTDAAGVPRWPAVPVELLFNAAFLVWAWTQGRHRERLRGQLFHIYLLAYGGFRLLHEPLRDTPRWGGGVTGYQLLALLLVLMGAVRYRQRGRARSTAAEAPC